MIYQYIAPSPALREFVRDYLVAHFVFDKDKPIPFKPYSPKPEQTITFLPRGNLTLVNPLNGEAQKAAPASVCGQQISRYNFYLTPEYLMLRVHFQPGALFRLLHVPLAEFTDLWLDAQTVISREILEVNERLAHCTSYAAMVATVEDYLTSKIKKAKADTHPLDKVAACIYSQPSRFSLDYLADQACLSPRQFNRIFTERMGIGPKLYNRIVRFYLAYQYKETHPKEDWLSIALLFGYSDYQHMVKDFKAFAHDTPSLWIYEDNQSPERLLHLE